MREFSTFTEVRSTREKKYIKSQRARATLGYIDRALSRVVQDGAGCGQGTPGGAQSGPYRGSVNKGSDLGVDQAADSWGSGGRAGRGQRTVHAVFQLQQVPSESGRVRSQSVPARLGSVRVTRLGVARLGSARSARGVGWRRGGRTAVCSARAAGPH